MIQTTGWFRRLRFLTSTHFIFLPLKRPISRALPSSFPLRSRNTSRSSPAPKIPQYNKIPHFRGGFLVIHGGIGGARTRDLGLKRALLYQLSYNPIKGFRHVVFSEMLAYCIKKRAFVQSFLFFRVFPFGVSFFSSIISKNPSKYCA